MNTSADKELKDLNPQERAYALKILEELQKNGNSKLYEDLVYSDYKEIPTDIITFIKDNRYLGKAWHLPNGKCKLFPFWEGKLKELFPDNIHTNYNTFIESGARGLGKAQPLTAKVLTIDGFKTMGEIKVGDKVMGVEGVAHNVTDVFPRGERDIYSVIFEDGTSTECCDEHLWEVWERFVTKREVLELKDILKDFKTKKYLIPLCAPVAFEERYLNVHPYVIGIIFACGLMLDNKLAITTPNNDIVNRVSKELAKNKCKLVLSSKESTYYIETEEKINPYIQFFIDNNISFNSGAKRIPEILKQNSISVRLNFVSGILDVVGNVNNIRKAIEFTMQCDECADEIAWMIRSLGGICVKTPRSITTQISRKSNETMVKNDYFISIRLSNNLLLTSVNREFDKCVVVDKFKAIKDIKYVGKKECKCILVDYPRHLYITDDFIVTHNSEIAVTVALYMMHRLMCMKNPHQTLNLKPTEKIAFAFMNITQKLAEEIGVSKFQETVQTSPWFMERGTITGRTNLIWNPPDYINIIIGSQSSDVIGQPIYYAFFDEVSFQKNKDVEMQKKKAMDMVDTAVGGMKTRFTNKGKNPTLLTLASSKRSEVSFLETYIKKKMDSKSTLIIDEPVWNVRPASEYSGKRFYVALGNRFLNSDVLPEGITDIELDIYRGKGYKILSVPIEYLDKFKDDVDRALCDYAGISSSELTTYISGVRLMECVNKDIENPFTKEILEIGNNPADTAQYYDFFDLSKIPTELKSRPLYIHLDMSVTGDKTGIAGVWIVNKKSNHIEGQPDSKELFYRVAFCVAIKAPKGYQVSYEKNRQFIYWLKEQGFNIKGVSSDSYQSADMLQQMRSKNFEYDIISVDRVSPNDHVCLPYAAFKSAIYEKRIEFYKHDLLIQEITGLEKNSSTGKVDHSPNSINCLAGDTKISLLDGREVTIKELVDEYNQGKENYVYTVNEQEHKIEPKLIENAFCSGHNAQLIEITLDNGEIIKCTPEHRFMLRNGVYCEARLLNNELALKTTTNEFIFVREIKYLSKKEDVYDLTIQDNHNFALSAGIFVHNSKDVSDGVCLAGDTEIFLLSGKHRTIKELYNEYVNGTLNDYILAYNNETNNIEPVPIQSVVDNGVKDNLVKLTFDNGEELICTEDHLLLTRNGDYVEAGKSLDVSLMPFNVEKKTMFKDRDYYYLEVPQKDLSNKGTYLHKLVAEYFHLGSKKQKLVEKAEKEYVVIHHKDCDRFNNLPSNLEYLTNTEHCNVHTSLNQTDAKRKQISASNEKLLEQGKHPFQLMSNEIRKEVGRKNCLAMNSTQQHKDIVSRATKQRYIDNPESFKKFFESSQSKEACIKRDKTCLEKYGGTGFNSNIIQQKCRESCLKNNGYDNPFNSSEKQQEMIISKIQNSWNRIVTTFGLNVNEPISLFDFKLYCYALNIHINSDIKLLNSLGIKVINANYDKKEYDRLRDIGCSVKMYLKETNKSYFTYMEFMNYFNKGLEDNKSFRKRFLYTHPSYNDLLKLHFNVYNHRVVSIERVSAQNVYDIKLNRIHNFAISAGIFVHNCGAMWNASQHSEEFSYDFGEDIPTMLNVSGQISDEVRVRNQVSVDFEKEMQKLLDPLSAQIKQNSDTKNSMYNPTYFNDGIMVW